MNKIIKFDPVNHVVTVQTKDGVKEVKIPTHARTSTEDKQAYLNRKLKPSLWQRFIKWLT
jgi:hypothetical protein